VYFANRHRKTRDESLDDSFTRRTRISIWLGWEIIQPPSSYLTSARKGRASIRHATSCPLSSQYPDPSLPKGHLARSTRYLLTSLSSPHFPSISLTNAKFKSSASRPFRGQGNIPRSARDWEGLWEVVEVEDGREEGWWEKEEEEEERYCSARR
jgi:hypothetical protein